MPINYMQTLTLAQGTTKAISMPKGKNVRILISSTADTLMLSFRDNVDFTSANFDGFMCNFFTKTAFILEPPNLFGGDLLYVSEPGIKNVTVSFWFMEVYE